ncbi:MAG: hypothetical protein HW383_473 [Candidatus Magasanikbacteria bacterium]|nr:hypothetical protein [Candidatus Magasanikbacteria bacterium]
MHPIFHLPVASLPMRRSFTLILTSSVLAAVFFLLGAFPAPVAAAGSCCVYTANSGEVEGCLIDPSFKSINDCDKLSGYTIDYVGANEDCGECPVDKNDYKENFFKALFNKLFVDSGKLKADETPVTCIFSAGEKVTMCGEFSYKKWYINGKGDLKNLNSGCLTGNIQPPNVSNVPKKEIPACNVFSQSALVGQLPGASNLGTVGAQPSKAPTASTMQSVNVQWKKNDCLAKGYDWLAAHGEETGHFCFIKPPETKLEIPIAGSGVIGGIANYIDTVYKYMLGFGGLIAAFMIVIAGVQWVFGSGAGSIGPAKKRIANAVVGLVILFAAYAMLNTINPDLVRLEPLRLRAVAPAPFVCCEGTAPGGFKVYAKGIGGCESGFKQIENQGLCESQGVTEGVPCVVGQGLCEKNGPEYKCEKAVPLSDCQKSMMAFGAVMMSPVLLFPGTWTTALQAAKVVKTTAVIGAKVASGAYTVSKFIFGSTLTNLVIVAGAAYAYDKVTEETGICHGHAPTGKAGEVCVLQGKGQGCEQGLTCVDMDTDNCGGNDAVFGMCSDGSTGSPCDPPTKLKGVNMCKNGAICALAAARTGKKGTFVCSTGGFLEAPIKGCSEVGACQQNLQCQKSSIGFFQDYYRCVPLGVNQQFGKPCYDTSTGLGPENQGQTALEFCSKGGGFQGKCVFPFNGVNTGLCAFGDTGSPCISLISVASGNIAGQNNCPTLDLTATGVNCNQFGCESGKKCKPVQYCYYDVAGKSCKSIAPSIKEVVCEQGEPLVFLPGVPSCTDKIALPSNGTARYFGTCE